MLSTPTWPPSPYQPLEPPPGRPRYAGIVMLAVLVAVVGAAAYLLRDAPPPETVDEAELNRLIADKRAELSMAERPMAVGSTEETGTTSLLYVDSDPSGAVVLLDADTVGITPLEGRTVKTGVYILSIRKEDYAPHDTVVFILEEDVVPRLFVDLSPADGYGRDEALITSRGSSLPDLNGSPATSAAQRGDRGRSQPPRSEIDSARDQQTGSTRSQTGSTRSQTGSTRGQTGSTRDQTGDRSARTAANQNSAPPQSSATQVPKEPPPVLTGLVTVLVRPWGSIYVDGHLAKLNTDVQHTAALPEGRHVVRVEHPALGTREQVVEIRNGQPRHVIFDLLESGAGGAEPQNAQSERAERGSGSGSSGDDG